MVLATGTTPSTCKQLGNSTLLLCISSWSSVSSSGVQKASGHRYELPIRYIICTTLRQCSSASTNATSKNIHVIPPACPSASAVSTRYLQQVLLLGVFCQQRDLTQFRCNLSFYSSKNELGGIKQMLFTHKKVYGPRRKKFYDSTPGQHIIHCCIKPTSRQGRPALPPREGPQRR